MEIKLHSFFCVSPAIPPHGEVFTTVLNYNEFVFAHNVNIRFICYVEIYLLTDFVNLPNLPGFCDVV